MWGSSSSASPHIHGTEGTLCLAGRAGFQRGSFPSKAAGYRLRLRLLLQGMTCIGKLKQQQLSCLRGAEMGLQAGRVLSP